MSLGGQNNKVMIRTCAGKGTDHHLDKDVSRIGPSSDKNAQLATRNSAMARLKKVIQEENNKSGLVRILILSWVHDLPSQAEGVTEGTMVALFFDSNNRATRREGASGRVLEVFDFRLPGHYESGVVWNRGILGTLPNTIFDSLHS